jgi:hypothetical protein
MADACAASVSSRPCRLVIGGRRPSAALRHDAITALGAALIYLLKIRMRQRLRKLWLCSVYPGNALALYDSVADVFPGEQPGDRTRIVEEWRLPNDEPNA